MRLGRDVCVAMLLLGCVLVACKRGKPGDEKSTDTTVGDKSGATEAPATTTAAAAPSPASGDAVGIPACDEFLVKWEKCADKYPAPAREPTKQGIQQARIGWKQAAANPAARASVEAGCKQMLETTKQATAAFGCEW